MDTQQNCLANLSFSTELIETMEDAEMVIEAVPENMALKKQLLNTIDEHTPNTASSAPTRHHCPLLTWPTAHLMLPE